MAKRAEEAAVEAALSTGSLSCRQPTHGYANRKLKLLTYVWSAVNSDLQRAGDVLD